jgi:hypothetical protein
MSQEIVAPKRKIDFCPDVSVRTFFKPFNLYACTILEPEFVVRKSVDSKEPLNTTEQPVDEGIAAMKKEKQEEAEGRRELKKTIASIFEKLPTETAVLLDEIRAFLVSNLFENVDEFETYTMCSDTPIYKVTDPGNVAWAGPDRETAILSTFSAMDEDRNTYTVQLRLVFPDETLQGEPTVVITTNGENVYHIPGDCSWDEAKEDITALISGDPDEDSHTLPNADEENDQTDDAPPYTTGSEEEETRAAKRQRL